MASRTISIRLTAEGADALKAQLLAIGVTGGEAMDALARATSRGAAGFETLQRSLDPLYAAQQRFEAQQARINAALAAGHTNQERATQLLGLAQARYDSVAQSMGRASTGFAGASDAAAAGTSRFGQAIGQAGFQVQDFAVQVAGGQSALLAFAQQGSQLAGVFGTGGAVAGAAIAIGAIAAQLLIGQSAAEAFADEMTRQGEVYDSLTREAGQYLAALRSQGDLYVSAEAQGQRYRQGLRGEGENLVALTRLYAGLTEARRAAEQASFNRDANSLAVQRGQLAADLAAPIAGRLQAQQGQLLAPDIAGGGLSLLASIGGNSAPQLAADLQRAVEAFQRFQQQGALTTEAVANLRRELVASISPTGANTREINSYIRALDEALPRVRDFDAAQRQLQLRQLALAGQGSPEQRRAAADMVAGEVGGVYQQRQRLAEQQRLLRSGLDVAGSPEAAAGYRASLQAVAAQMEGLTPATAQMIRSLREQAEVMRYAEGAARTYAESDLALDRAARAAGAGMASAAEKAAARSQIQARLNEEVGHALDAVDRQVIAENILVDALTTGGNASRQAEARVKALAEARRYASVTEERYGVILEALTRKYEEAAASAQRLQDARALYAQGQELEGIRRETELLGLNADVRERELAILRERQRILATPGADINSAEAQARLANAGALADARQELERTKNLYAELESLGSRAFDRIGTAITQAFANGSLKALDFRNIANAVFSEVLQSALKLAVVNPLINATFGGTRASIFAGGGVATSASTGASASGMASPFGIPNPSGLRGFTDGTFSSGWGWLDSTINTPLYSASGVGTQYAFNLNPADVTVGGAIGGALGIAGGAYGIYSGLQTGGARGGLQVAGGVAGIGAGATALAGGAGAVGAAGTAALGATAGAALGALAVAAPYLAAIAAIAAMFVPGQKPSNAAAGAMFNLGDGSRTLLDSGKSVAATRDGRDQLVTAYENQIAALLPLTGGQRPAGTVGFNVGARDGSDIQYYSPAVGQVFGERYETGDADRMTELVGRSLLYGYRDQVALAPDIKAIFANSAGLNDAIASLQWYSTTYKPMLDSIAADAAGTSQTNALKALADQVAALQKPFQEAAAKAASLGLATAQLAEAQAKAVADFEAARAKQQELTGLGLDARLLLATGREIEAALLEQRVKAEQERQSFEQQLLQLAPDRDGWRAEMLGKLDAVQAAERQQLLDRQQAPIRAAAEAAAQAAAEAAAQASAKAAADAVAQATQQAAAIRQGGTGFFDQLIFGNLGGLAPSAQYQAGLQSLSGAGADLLNGGGPEAMARYTSLAQSFLPIARSFLGTSESYASLVADIAGTVRSAGGDPQSIAALFEAQAGGLDRIGSALAALGSSGDQQVGIARDTLTELRRLASAIEALLARRVLT